MKKLTPLQAKAIHYISEHDIDELIYVKQHLNIFGITRNGDESFYNNDRFYETFSWTHKDAKILKDGWNSPKFNWCIDGKTIKALYARNILVPSVYENGKYGEYPIAYTLNIEVFSKYLEKL